MQPGANPRVLRRALGGFLLGAVALTVCIVVAGLGLRGLVLDPTAANRLRDDAFYEFVWAANVAAGHGATVSDGTTTSGVQLLWSLLLVPFAACFGAPSLPLLAPWLGTALHAATAMLWWRGGRDRRVAAGVALLWLGNPLLLRECQNGQETALACLLASLLWLHRRGGEWTWLSLSLLAVMARTDLWFVVATLALWRACRLQRLASLWAPLAALCLVGGASRWLGGSYTPDSGLPMAWLWHSNQRLVDPSFAAFAATSWWFARPAMLGGPFAIAAAMPIGFACAQCFRAWLPTAWRALPLLLVGCAWLVGGADLATPLWAAAFLLWWPRRRCARLWHPLLPLVVGLAAIVVLHWAVRWYPRDYYLGPLVVVGIGALARYGRVGGVLLIAAVAQWCDLARVQPEPLAGQQELELAGRHLAAVLPVGERVGCFNSGLVTFHADVLAPVGQRRGIVNLDGVVDARAFAALRGAALAAWLDQEGVRFVLDNPVQFVCDPRQPHACGHWFGPDFASERDLVECARFDVPGLDNGRPGGDSVRLYWRRGRGMPPPERATAQQLAIEADGSRVVLWPARAGQTLQLEDADGMRRSLLMVDVDTAAVVRIQTPCAFPAQLFVDAGQAPVLALAPL